MSMNARVLLDSVGPNEARLTTFELTLPRIVLAEFNTHRMLSRNSASSRAIPVEKMLERVRTSPFVPEYWGKNQKGMQAEQELTEDQQHAASTEWKHASLDAFERARALKEIGVHKQITNRLLEPFLFHTIIFTATELDNFIALRANKMAAPEIRKPAEMLVDVYKASKPMQLRAGEWHLPLCTGYDLLRAENTKRWTTIQENDPIVDPEHFDWLYWARISAARCGRVSYLTHEGKRDLVEDERRYSDLVTQGHMSPLEHPAKALTHEQWLLYAEAQANDWIHHRSPVGNFWGWRQFRKEIAGEHNFALLQ